MLAQRGSGHTGGPDLGVARDRGLFVRLHVLVGHALPVHVGDQGVQDDLNAKVLKLAASLAAQALAERRQNLRAAVDEDNAGVVGVDLAELLGEGAVRHLSQLTSQLHTGRASADDHEVQQAAALLRVAGDLGALEGAGNAGADLQGIVDRLHARRELSEVVVTEVGLCRTGSEDQGVILDDGFLTTQVSGDVLAVDVDVADLTLDHADVLVIRHQLTDGRGNLTFRQDTGRDLVQQWLEQVVVGAVDDGDRDVLALELLCREQTAETAADNDNVVALTCWTKGVGGHRKLMLLSTIFLVFVFKFSLIYGPCEILTKRASTILMLKAI